VGEAAGQVGSGGDLIPWLKGLLYDPRSFANFVRFGVFVGGELLSGLVPNTPAWYVGKALSSVALLIKAGDKNPALVPPQSLP
jgi:hypothetical protein